MSEDEKLLPSDEELSEMLSRADGRKPGRKPKRDPNKPSPRLPEALYYFLFIQVEAAILIGVWGFMRMGIGEAMRGPSIEAPILDQLAFHLKSIGIGLGHVFAHQPWVPILAAVMALPVFMPTTPKSRKRMATFVSTVLVALFVMLIAFQFNEDIANAGAMARF